MKKQSFAVAYDKIVTAYYEDKLAPYDFCGCFIGTLLNNTDSWKKCRFGYDNNWEPFELEDAIYGGYSSKEITKLEGNFLKIIYNFTEGKCRFSSKYEEALYLAMESTLLLLKKIHEDSGEVIDSYQFTKRQEKQLV